MIRILLFFFANFSTVFVLEVFLKIFKISTHTIYGLLFITFILGFFGSLISLLLSKHLSLQYVRGKIIRFPKSNFEIWLLNKVREQSLIYGILPPEVAIYPAIDINAFATGFRKNYSLVAFSVGLIQTMTLDEIEAVIAHEISHIVNGDMVTITLLQGILNTFVMFFARLISKILSFIFCCNNDSHNEEYGNKFLYLFCAVLLEWFFGLFATIIVMWFSRYREFAADYNSAKLVGKQKMILALERLKLSHEPCEHNSIIAFCINGKTKNIFNRLFLSHPPLSKRIKVLRNK